MPVEDRFYLERGLGQAHCRVCGNIIGKGEYRFAICIDMQNVSPRYICRNCMIWIGSSALKFEVCQFGWQRSKNSIDTGKRLGE